MTTTMTTTTPKRYRCWWCDRTTADEAQVILDRATGYLKCRDCATYEIAQRVDAMLAKANSTAAAAEDLLAESRASGWLEVCEKGTEGCVLTHDSAAPETDCEGE